MAEVKEEVKSEVVASAEAKPVSASPVAASASTSDFERRKNTSKIRPKRNKDGKGNKEKGKNDDYDQKIIHIRRVSRSFKGGRRMRLSVFIAVGDRKGKVGLGVGKGADIRAAQEKAFNNAKKNLVSIALKNNTIPHEIKFKFGAAKVLLKPAAPGTGIVAGSSMRILAEVAGVKDVLGKIMGTNNKISNAYATLYALQALKTTRI